MVLAAAHGDEDTALSQDHGSAEYSTTRIAACADGSGFAAEKVGGVLPGGLLEEPPVQFGGECMDRAGQVCVGLEF